MHGRHSNDVLSVHTLTDYSRVDTRDTLSPYHGLMIARFVTGLSPNGNDGNGVLGGLYFNGSIIPNIAIDSSCDTTSSAALIQPKPADNSGNVGVIRIQQCKDMATAGEGVYTFVMMNSSMMNESIKFGVYFKSRSESLDIIIHPIIPTTSF